MKTIKAVINNVKNINEFNKAVQNFSYDVDIKSGRYIIDAKSLMGLYSIDLSNPVEIIVDDENYDEVYKVVKDFVVA